MLTYGFCGPKFISAEDFFKAIEPSEVTLLPTSAIDGWFVQDRNRMNWIYPDVIVMVQVLPKVTHL